MLASLRWPWVEALTPPICKGTELIRIHHIRRHIFSLSVHSTSYRCVCWYVCLLACAELWRNQRLSSLIAVAMKCTENDSVFVCVCVAVDYMYVPFDSGENYTQVIYGLESNILPRYNGRQLQFRANGDRLRRTGQQRCCGNPSQVCLIKDIRELPACFSLHLTWLIISRTSAVFIH